MKISVVTAVYNRSTTVAHAIGSLHGQTHRNFEHVVQDGGSTDGTLQVIGSLATDATLLETGTDDGLYDAINRGIARATGEVLGLLHSDDFFASSDVLARVAEAFQDPGIQGVYGDLDYVSATDPQKIIRRWRSGPYSPDKLKRGWMPPHPTLFLRRDVFSRLGVYDTSFRIAADYDAMLRYLARGQIQLAYIPEVFVKMRIGGESNRSLERILKKTVEDYRALRKNKVGGAGTLLLKNFSKVPQFFVKER